MENLFNLQSTVKKSESKKSTSEEIDAYLAVHRSEIDAAFLDDIRAASPEAREFAARQEAMERLRSDRGAPGIKMAIPNIFSPNHCKAPAM